MIRDSQRKQQLKKLMPIYRHQDAMNAVIEYVKIEKNLALERLLNETGEQAIVLRGELRVLNNLLNVLERGDSPVMDTVV